MDGHPWGKKQAGARVPGGQRARQRVVRETA
jgi:hypothetical protein